MCNPMITQPKNIIFRSKHSKQVSTCDIHWHLMTCFRIPNLINGISPSPASKELVLPVQHVDQLLGFFCIAMMLQLLHHDPTMTQPGPRTGQNAPADSNYMELVPSPKIFRTSMTSIWSAFFRRRSQVLFHHRVIFGSCWNCACESFFRLCPETKFTPIPGLKPRGPIGPSDFSSKKYRMGPPSYNLIYKPWNNPH